MQRVTCVLCDVDGTLVDSNAAHAQAWATVLAAHGYAVPVERLRRLIGMGSDKLLPAAAQIDADSALGRELAEERAALFERELLPGLQPCRGAAALLRHIRAQGRTLVTVSSARGDELGALLRVTGAADVFAEHTSSDDAERSKPDPDIIAVGLARAGCAADQAIMLGDTPYDIEAATQLGVGVIAFRTGGWPDEELAGALAIYDDPADLLGRYDQSPLG